MSLATSKIWIRLPFIYFRDLTLVQLKISAAEALVGVGTYSNHWKARWQFPLWRTSKELVWQLELPVHRGSSPVRPSQFSGFLWIKLHQEYRPIQGWTWDSSFPLSYRSSKWVEIRDVIRACVTNLHISWYQCRYILQPVWTICSRRVHLLPSIVHRVRFSREC